MEIRRLTVDDIDFLRNACELFWEKISDDQQLNRFLKYEKNYAYIALDNEMVAGFAFGYILDTFYSEPMFYIHSIDVADSYRRKGLGKSIMNKMMDDCKALGIKECFLITNKSNIPAMNLYQSVGGKPLSDDDDIVYQWNF